MDASVDEQALDSALKRALFANAFAPWCLGILTVFLCAWFLYGRVPVTGLICWAAVSLFVGIVRLPLLFKVRRFPDSKLPAKQYTALVGITGLVWGCLALFWTDQLQASDQLVILLAPLTLSLGGIISFSAWRNTYRSFVLCTQVPVLIIIAIIGDAEIARVIPALLFLLVACLFMGERFYLHQRETLSLRLRNQQLVNDLSDQNDTLKAARDDAQEACQVRDEFLARMSHELRTPMNGVLGISQLLSNTSLDMRQSQLMKKLQQSGNSMLVLIDNLLDASSLVIGEIDLYIRPYDIAQVLDSISMQSALAVEQKNLALKMDIDADIPQSLLGDERRISQMLSALVDNAIKFTPKGNVSVQVSRTQNNQSVDDTACAEQLQFVIVDTGIGIEPSELHRVSELFYQTDGDADRRFGGTGLGLSIAKSLVDLMGGTLSISSEPGKGTNVIVSMPLMIDPAIDGHVSAQVVSAGVPASPTLNQAQCSRVLVVEDNPINQLVLEAMLEDLNCDVTVVENGFEALSELEASEFEIVFMDCQMPKLDGYGATLQARDKGYQLPIIAVTANAMIGDREKCLSVGMDDYVSKPFTADTINRVLQKWIGAGELKMVV